MESLPAMVLRGGTSKGVFFAESDVPVSDFDRRERLLLNAFGSPDPMQIDGIGGSHSTTSKAVIVDSIDRGDPDVEYTFGQVGVEKPVVDWGGNCGNLTFAVAAFAAERGLIDPEPGGRRTVTLLNTNTDTLIEQSLEIGPDGAPRYLGPFSIDGVPGDGSRVRSRFLDPAGRETGALFPTGERREPLETEYGMFEVSIVDVTNPVVFVHEDDVTVGAHAKPDTIDAATAAVERLEAVRSAACERLGFVEDASVATERSPGLPKVAFVGEPRQYETIGGRTITRDSHDILGRIMSMQKAHHAYAVTGAMCTATAARIPGTIPNHYATLRDDRSVVLGHPKGLMPMTVDLDTEPLEIEAVGLDRTARKIMTGTLYYRPPE